MIELSCDYDISIHLDMFQVLEEPQPFSFLFWNRSQTVNKQSQFSRSKTDVIFLQTLRIDRKSSGEHIECLGLP